MKKPTTGVVILAAGRGTRMAHELPKVLVPVGGVPLVLRAVSAVEGAALARRLVVVVGEGQELVRRAVGRRARYATQRRPLGTGHAVAAAAGLLEGWADEVLVVYGDSPFLSPRVLRRLVALRRRTKAVLAMTTITVPDFRGPRRVLRRYGRIVRGPRGRFVRRCVEFKDASRRARAIREVNSGHYCFDARWLWRHLPALRRHNAKREYYLTDLIGLAVAEGARVAPLPLTDWVEGLGVNTLAEVRIAERLIERP